MAKLEPDLIQQFIKQPEKLTLLRQTCRTPPYPDIPSLDNWLRDNTFPKKYEAFSLRPYGKRRLDFTFKRQNYTKQASKFEGGDNNPLFTEDIGDKLQQQLASNRKATITSLKATHDELRTKHSDTALSDEDKLKLLCVTIEILARTASQTEKGDPPKVISQELNTTQVMALYGMIVNPGSKLISEIDTGEGKSRIMMILAAINATLGKTVDFITSDMQLAERDYLSYKQFFKALNIKTSLISLNTPSQLYQKGGVNFSDNSQLLLLRNKCDIENERFAFLDEREHMRCLLIDEVDKFKHDKSKDSYNYAASSKRLTSFIWIYTLLVQFMAEQLQKNNNQKMDMSLLIDPFLQYVSNHDASMLHQASLAELRQKQPNQLILWLNSAYTASKMERDRHFKESEADESKLYTVRDSEGHTLQTRKIFVLDNGRPAEGSTFSDGVHQCLCARANLRLGKEEFVILPENETQRSSYPVTFMANYQQGTIYGVSGTTRSAAPKSSKAINYENYDYFKVPREKKLIREDKNTWVAKGKNQHIEFIKRSIKEKLNNNCPILLICKDDNQSRELNDALTSDSEFMELVQKVQHVHGLTDSQDEKEAIKHAGLERFVTISTAGMFGRGVDINASDLFVLAAYVPTLEDEIQIKGRTARAGKPGEFRMIVNIDDPYAPLDGQTYNIDNEINKYQNKKAINAIFREEVSKLYALFLEKVTQRFLRDLHACPLPESRFGLLASWQGYLGDMQKDWNTKAEQLLELVETEQQEAFTHSFNDFTEQWLRCAPISPETNESKLLLDDLKISQVYTGLLSQKGFFVPKRQPIKVQRRYDPADDGQARVYSSLFAREIATLKGERRWFADYHAWREGRGDLFPDLMAVLRGERPLFANLRATIERWMNELVEWWHSIGNTGELGKPAPEIDEDDLLDDIISSTP